MTDDGRIRRSITSWCHWISSLLPRRSSPRFRRRSQKEIRFPQRDSLLLSLKIQVHKLQKAVDEEKRNRESFVETKTRDMSALEMKYSQALDSESMSRKESESRLIRAIEEKFAFLENELIRESKTRSDVIQGMHSGLEVPSSLLILERASTNKRGYSSWGFRTRRNRFFNC